MGLHGVCRGIPIDEENTVGARTNWRIWALHTWKEHLADQRQENSSIRLEQVFYPRLTINEMNYCLFKHLCIKLASLIGTDTI